VEWGLIVAAIDSVLDGRFSEPDARPIDWETTRRTLESAELSWISTVRGDGRPHVSPLVTVWLDDALYFTTGPSEQKAKNLEQNTHVVVTTGSNGWRAGIDVTVEGGARRVLERDLLERLVEAWRARWDGSWTFRVGDGVFHSASGGVSHVFEVAPSKVLAFGKSPFGQTRHRFSCRRGGGRS
jgi:general stress protein 26